MASSVARSPSWLTAFRKSGRYVCQDCDHERQPQNRGEKNLKVTVDDKGIVAHCHHCNANFIHSWDYKDRDQRNMTPAVEPFPTGTSSPPPGRLTTAERLDDHRPLSERALAYLADRKISPETARHYGMVSGDRFFRSRKEAPAGRFEGVGFGYADDAGKVYAIKWRALDHRNWVADGAAHTLFGPTTVEAEDLWLTEGEMDAPSIYEATKIEAKSIPNGSSDEAQQGSKLNFLDRNFDRIKAAKRVVLALDNDKPGQQMAEEIARRVGRSKVWRVVMPADRKDMNEVLVKDGAERVAEITTKLEPWPVEGLLRASDARAALLNLHQHGMPPGQSTGWRHLDPYWTVQEGMLHIVTGKPGGGKSAFIDNLMVNLSDRAEWTWGVASFESPIQLQLARLIAVRHGMPFRDIDPASVEKHMAWADEHFHFLTSDGLVTIDNLLERADVAVTRYGIRGLVIDPFNYIRTPGREMDTEGVNEMLSKLKTFCVSREVAGMLVAHPAKPGTDNDDWIPTGYSVAGSAHFYNRADFGITIARAKGPAELEGDTQAVIWKCKWSHLGKEGRVMLDFDPATERFTQRRTATAYDRDGDDPFQF